LLEIERGFFYRTKRRNIGIGRNPLQVLRCGIKVNFELFQLRKQIFLLSVLSSSYCSPIPEPLSVWSIGSSVAGKAVPLAPALAASLETVSAELSADSALAIDAKPTMSSDVKITHARNTRELGEGGTTFK
jgi:hypothetical protein